MDYKTLLEETKRIAGDDKAVAQAVYLKPTTFENRSLIALELHSDRQSKKPGILVVGGILTLLVTQAKIRNVPIL